jgi:hypothetical protein
MIRKYEKEEFIFCSNLGPWFRGGISVCWYQVLLIKSEVCFLAGEMLAVIP